MILKSILIKHSPAFASLKIFPSKGLNVITGASGAGKSVFFHSLLALMGLKESNASVLEAEIEGDVDLRDYPQEDEILLQILKKDKTRYYLNETSSSKRSFVEIFSPYLKCLTHKQSNELQSAFLLDILDALIEDLEHQERLKKFTLDFARLQELQKTLAALQEEQKHFDELKELALFEVQKIESISPKIGEYEELLELKKRLSKREKLQAQSLEALNALEQMGGIERFLENVQVQIEGFPEMMLEVRAAVESESEKLNELLESDPEEVLDRLSALSSLIHRYGGIEEALERLKEQREKLKNLEHLDEDFHALHAEIEHLKVSLNTLSKALREMRQKSLPILQKQISSYAQLLLLGEVHLNLEETKINEQGRDELLISLRDSQVQTLSSGEYNRLRLAVLATERKKEGGILLLDEIDANLSGEESEGVAKVLKQLSQNYQVFAISHQPHLPACADTHFLVRKTQEGSEMFALDQASRVQEIARMISGSTLTPEAIEFANKKLQQ